MSQNPPSQPSSAMVWPGAFGAYRLSRDAVLLNIWTVIGLAVINFAASFGLPVLTHALHLTTAAGQLASYAVSIFVSAVTIVVYLAGVRHKKVSIEEACKDGFQLVLQYLVLAMLIGLIALLSLLLFVVPFFFVLPRLLLAPYFLVDQKLEPIDALKASWNASTGNMGKIWGIIGVAFLFAALCLVLVGIYFSIMYSAILAVFYLYLAHTARPAAEPERRS